MSRGVHLFKQSDVTKALKATTKAGLEIQRVEIGPGDKIVIFAGKLADPKIPEFANEWDSVIK